MKKPFHSCPVKEIKWNPVCKRKIIIKLLFCLVPNMMPGYQFIHQKENMLKKQIKKSNIRIRRRLSLWKRKNMSDMEEKNRTVGI